MLQTRINSVVEWVMALKPVRVFTRYNERRGPLLASGLSFQALFAAFAAIWVAFTVAGFVIISTPELEKAIIGLLSTSVPGLIDDGSGSGVVNPSTLLSPSSLTWTGVIAGAGLIFTAVGWLASGRDAVRTLFGLPDDATNFILLKLKDFGLALAFSAALLISAALSVVSTTALGSVLAWAGVDNRSDAATLAARIAGLLIVLLLDTVVLALFYRVVSGVHIPTRLLAQGTIIAAVALGVLKVLGASLLGGATRNPLLASFAAIIGLLIWFNLICQVILLGAAWIKVSAEDVGIDLRGSRRATGAAGAAGSPDAAGHEVAAASGVGAAL